MRAGECLSALVIGLILLMTAVAGQAVSSEDVEISGTAIDDGGHPLEDVNITAENVTSGVCSRALTDEEGHYNISLPQGVYNISGSLTNYSSNTTYDMVSVEGDIADLDFALSEELGRVTGFVTNGTVPIADAEIHIRNEEHEYTATSTIPLGEYEIAGIQPGTYLAYVDKEGYQPSYHPDPVVVSAGGTTEVSFNLPEESATLFGRAIYGTRGVTGVKVDVVSDNFSTSTYTDSHGNYSLLEIPVGDYQVMFSKEDFVSQEFQVTLDPEVPKLLDVTLEKEADPGGGFIPGFDLPHSLMVVGLMLALIAMILALFIRFRFEKRPELLEKEEVTEEAEEREE